MRAKEFIKEFAQTDGDRGEEDILHKYARMWYNGDLHTQDQVEKVLDRTGWEIGEIESEEGGCFVVRSGDEHGNSYIGFAPEDLSESVVSESAAWRRKEGKSKEGGLNAKGVASYRREHPGSKLQTAVTTKPSKLKKGSKAAKRRKSFCARMGGVDGPMKKPNGEPTRKALALRKWNCE